MQTEEQSLHCTLVSEYYWVVRGMDLSIDVPVHVNKIKTRIHSVMELQIKLQKYRRKIYCIKNYNGVFSPVVRLLHKEF